MIRLSGLQVKDELHTDGDIEIKYTGLRAGEKLYEELLIGDNVSKTENPLIMRAKEDMYVWDELKPLLDLLKKENAASNLQNLRNLLIKIVPAFTPENKINDILYVDEIN